MSKLKKLIEQELNSILSGSPDVKFGDLTALLAERIPGYSENSIRNVMWSVIAGGNFNILQDNVVAKKE